MTIRWNEQWSVHCTALASNIMRISVMPPGKKPGTLLNRYGFIDDIPPVKEAEESTGKSGTILRTGQLAVLLTAAPDRLALTFKTGDTVVLEGTIEKSGENFQASFGMRTGEQFFGFGDAGRETMERTGFCADMWIENVVRYIPIPFMMSTAGYGLFLNTTRRHTWDMGKKTPGKWRIALADDGFDFYLIHGPGFKDILSGYTAITGRPPIPPKWSFGLWFICRYDADSTQVMNDAVNFRDRKIPCDVIGLEPGWMEKFYDCSVEKKWHPDRFRIPSWDNKYNFIKALKRMGYKLELWLCNDYDLTYEAEREVGRLHPETEAAGPRSSEDVIRDEHFAEPMRMDKITRPEEPWFRHLEKFVDDGADFFKEDGAYQTLEHPDRLYGNGRTDAEIHNLYPLLYSKQMYDGFRRHTNRRPCCFTPNGWAGLQRYTGTWAGDTGGREKTLVSCLNLAMSGHGLVACDMDVTAADSIHYAFLMPWTQVNSFDSYMHPWLLDEELYRVFCFYAELKNRLIPYLYSYAHQAHLTGIPMFRPVMLEFPSPEAAGILNAYFLGRELLVTAFDAAVCLPEGAWYDYWTGERYTGPARLTYTPPEGKGGGLFVRGASIIPLGPKTLFTGQRTREGSTLQVFIESGETASFSWYDDDGVSLAYETDGGPALTLKASFDGHSVALDIPVQLPVETFEIHSATKPAAVLVNRKDVPFAWRPAVPKQ